MSKTTANIIKSNQVDLQGQFQIDINQPAPAENKPGQAPQKNNAPAKAILVENKSDCAIVEITCSCGKKTYLNCQYETDSNNSGKIVGENNNED